MKNPIIVALDVDSPETAVKLAQELSPYASAFKIGSELFTRAGPEIVRRIRGLGAAVFLDLKFHDIPNTVAKAVAAATRLDVQMMTVHASGGSAMMKAAEESAQREAMQMGRPAPLVLAVTVLTSFDSDELSLVGVASDVGRQVERLAALAVGAGLRGLVCSPLEITDLRQILPREMHLVTPGIRSTGQDPTDDQKRIMSAKEALTAGASRLVIGRPIYGAPNPAAAAEAILRSLE